MADHFLNIYNGINYRPQSSDPSNVKEGDVFRSDGTSRAAGLWEYKSGAWQEIGGGGGGGLDVFYTDNHETNGISNHTTGNNAAFEGGGTLDGTLSLDTTTQINGDQGLKYVMGATSANDYIASEVITVSEKHQGNTIGFELYIKYDGDDDDMRFVIWDDTNNVELTDGTEFIKASSSAKRLSVQAYIPDGVIALKYGYMIVTGNSGKILLADDVTGTSSPFVAKNLQLTQTINYSEAGNLLQDATAEVRFSTSLIQSLFIGNTLLTIEDDSGNTRTKFVAQSKCVVDISFSASISTAEVIHLYKNGTTFMRGSHAYVATAQSSASASIELDVGDYLTVGSAGAINSSGQLAYLAITATAPSDQIIAYNSRNAANLVVRGAGNSGTAITASVTDLDFTEVTDTGFGGSNFDGSLFTAPSDGIYMFTGGANWTTSAERRLRFFKDTISDDFIGAGDIGAFTFSGTISLTKDQTVSIRSDQAGTLSNSTTLHTLSITKIGVGDLLGVPVPLTGYLKDVRTSGTEGGTFTSGSYITRTLNTEESDFSKFGTLSSNQFTLDAGTYHIHAFGVCRSVDENKMKIRNITDSTDDIIGISSRTEAGAADNGMSTIQGSLTLTSSKTFELQHRCTSTQATNGQGVASSYGDSEVYVICTITKLN